MWKIESTPGSVAHVLGEGLDLLARVDREADGDHRLQRAPERGEVDLGVEAADDPALAQRAHPRERGRRRDADAVGEARVGDARVGREQLEEAAVDVVQVASFGTAAIVADRTEESAADRR